MALEVVTLYRRQADDTFDAGTACTALSRARLGTVEGESPRVRRARERFHLKADEAGTPEPKHDDVIEESDGTRWAVDDADTMTLGTRYQCDTTQEV